GGHNGRAARDYLRRFKLRRGSHYRVEDVRRRDDKEVNVLSGFLRERDNAAEEQLLVAREEVLLADVFVARVRPLHNLHGHHDEVFLARVRHLKGLPDVFERVVVAHEAERVSGSNLDSLVRDRLLRLKPELVNFDVRGGPSLTLVDSFGDEEDDEEDYCEGDAADGRNLLRDEIYSGDREQKRRDDAESERDFVSVEPDVERHLPLALAPVFEPQHEDGQPLEGERPDDAEGVRLTEHVDVSARADDSQQLQYDYQVNHSVGRAVASVRRSEPV